MTANDNGNGNGRPPTIREMFAETKTDVKWIKRWMGEHKEAHKKLDDQIDALQHYDEAGEGVRSFLWRFIPLALQILAIIAAIIGLKIGGLL